MQVRVIAALRSAERDALLDVARLFDVLVVENGPEDAVSPPLEHEIFFQLHHDESGYPAGRRRERVGHPLHLYLKPPSHQGAAILIPPPEAVDR
jgi:hypothetical protein